MQWCMRRQIVHDGTYLSRWVGFGRRSGLFRVSFIVGFRIHLVLSFRSVTLNVANISEVSARATYYSSALAYSIQHKTVNRPWRLQRLRLAHLAFRAGAFAERSRRGSRQWSDQVRPARKRSSPAFRLSIRSPPFWVTLSLKKRREGWAFTCLHMSRCRCMFKMHVDGIFFWSQLK